MSRSTIAKLAAAAALAAMVSAPAFAAPVLPERPALGEAQQLILAKGGHHGHSGHSGHHHGHFHSHFRPYGFYYIQPSGCGWLRAKAIDTGSRYWWRRYRACIEGW